MGFTSYRDLEVWQKAMNLVVLCYDTTRGFPKNELYGLCSELQRAPVSIPANIAEGRHRIHSKEFARHLSIAHGTLAELETHVLIAERLGYIDENYREILLAKAAEVGRMINGLRRSIKKS
jgi:four helix bundle protein